MIEQRESSENEFLKDTGLAFGDPSVLRRQVLLHSCCGPCSTSVVERLAPQYKITIDYCNSNIDDEAEYQKRLEAQKEYIAR